MLKDAFFDFSSKDPCDDYAMIISRIDAENMSSVQNDFLIAKELRDLVEKDPAPCMLLDEINCELF